MSTEVGLLGLSLYVLGFATGPILWAPLSELRGRKLPLLVAMFGFTIFQIAVAVGKDLQTVLICRFFGGVFGSCPLAVVAAIFSDVSLNLELLYPYAMFKAVTDVWQSNARPRNHRFFHDGLYGAVFGSIHRRLHRHKSKHGMAMDRIHISPHGVLGVWT